MNAGLSTTPAWLRELKVGVLEQHVQLVIFSYTTIKSETYSSVPKENTRRNALIKAMRRNKDQFGIISLIISESGQFNDKDEDTGRMDITCYLDQCEDNYITFECKRFLKKDIVTSNFNSQFVGEGVQRFQDNKYSSSMTIAGTISFIESGDYKKAHTLFVSELPKACLKSSMVDQSTIYNHEYVFNTIHARKNNTDITLTHILMDFTHNKYPKSS